jgi:hypothetical protein
MDRVVSYNVCMYKYICCSQNKEQLFLRAIIP